MREKKDKEIEDLNKQLSSKVKKANHWNTHYKIEKQKSAIEEKRGELSASFEKYFDKMVLSQRNKVNLFRVKLLIKLLLNNVYSIYCSFPKKN